MDDHYLRCNNLDCRAELQKKALVLTCSHIFCLDCARQSVLANPEQHRVCPACRSSLPNPDDAVIANLNPTEDYKTSILSGLSPGVIMECAGRALSFWAYQMSQEIVYQGHLGKNLLERHSNLQNRFDKATNDYNATITDYQDKLTDVSMDRDTLRRKNADLVQAVKEKKRKLLQTQELYDKLKQKAMLGQVQDAAFNAVDHVTSAHGLSHEDRMLDYRHVEEQRQRSNMLYEFINRSEGHENAAASGLFIRQAPKAQDSWARASRPQGVPVSPPTHRQRVGQPPEPNLRSTVGVVTDTPGSTPGLRGMRPVGGTAKPNMTGTSVFFPGIGLSSGVKTSHPGGLDGLSAPSTDRSRVFERPVRPINFNLTTHHSKGPGLFGGRFE